MPFQSEDQRRFLWANHPDIAQRWSNEYGSKPVDSASSCPECGGKVNKSGKCSSCGYMVKKAPVAKKLMAKKKPKKK